MPLSKQIKEKISIEVIKTLVIRFESFPEDASNNRNAPFHEAFLNAFSDRLAGKVCDTPFFISLSSWLHGLNTTLGQIFFEKVAHHLCDGEKREYTSKKLGNLQIHQNQRNNISQIIADLSNSTQTPNLNVENNLVCITDDTSLIRAMDFSADVYVEDDEQIIAIELKSVKPNSGEMKGEKQKILEGKAALFTANPTKNVRFYIGFPFDPTVNPVSESVTSYNKVRFLGSIINMNKYFASDETLLASELWDFLSGQKGTMEEILEIINVISTPNFLSKFRLLTDNSQRITFEYRALLHEWNLFSELDLIDHNAVIIERIGKNTSLKKIYNKIAFDSKGSYNKERYSQLKLLLC